MRRRLNPIHLDYYLPRPYFSDDVQLWLVVRFHNPLVLELHG